METDLMAQLARLCKKLDRRLRAQRVFDSYYEGDAPLPKAVKRAKVTAAYQLLMPMASSNWASLIVDSVQDRLEVAGVRTGSAEMDRVAWDIWQRNFMDSESKLAHNAALVSGRAHALIWPDRDGNPEITLDDSSQVVIEYREGSRHHRLAALRRWVDDAGRPYATLYRPDGIYKFQGPKNSSGQAGTQWERREVDDEPWPLGNPLKVVPAVEVAVNRRLKPGAYPFACGDFATSVGHIDRINLLTFLGLVVAFWLGFPVRVLIGDKILKDDEGNTLPPFEAMADQVVQFEDPDVKLAEYKAADLKNFSVTEHVEHLAAITKTPPHYLLGQMANLSADAIRASEAALASKVTNHKASIGEGWEEVLRIAGMMHPSEIAIPPGAEVWWKDHESRSMAERADAALKLKDILPWQVLAERVLNATQEEVARWESQRASDGFGEILAELNSPVEEPEPLPA